MDCDSLVSSHMRWAKGFMPRSMRYNNRRYEYDEVFSDVQLALLKAARNYDTAKGEFKAYARKYLIPFAVRAMRRITEILAKQEVLPADELLECKHRNSDVDVEAVSIAMGRLKDAQVSLLRAVFYDGISRRCLAKSLNLTPQAVDLRVKRALSFLKYELERLR